MPTRAIGSEVVAGAEQLAAALSDAGPPVRHAGSFGLDFVALDSFFDTAVDRHLLRVAATDLPATVARIADGIGA